MRRLLPAAAALLAFTGCTLIDQRTFAPSPEAKAQTPTPAPPPAAAALPLDPRTPLVTIDYTVPSPDYAELLHYAVSAAEKVTPKVDYDVVLVLKDAAEVAKGQDRATGVMKAIIRDRVPAARVHLALFTDPSLAATQVRIYVR